MEDKLLEEFQSYCKFNCKYKKGNYVSEDDFKETAIIPCDYCQIQEFIREVSDRL